MNRLDRFVVGLKLLHEFDPEAEIGSEHDIFYFWLTEEAEIPEEVEKLLENKYHWYRDKDESNTFYWYT